MSPESNPPAAGTERTGAEIAIVGLAGRFPGAPDVETFWTRVCACEDALHRLSDERLAAAGIQGDRLSDPDHVKAGMLIDGLDRFDAGYFGYSPREAEQLDPQQRFFLETAVQALDHAGYGADRPLTGVYAGCGANLYLMRHVLPSQDWRSSDLSALLGVMNGNDKDSLATRVAYKLDLRGPAVTVQSACSTSLAAVHLACRGLLNHEADLALAGGVWLNLLQEQGYRHESGSILSPDGRCRPFDAESAGTVVGSGVGVVVLKRLSDALADGDTVHAVILGSAVNNDGAAKVGFTAPSVDGQAAVILAAQAMADVPADTIGYVEAHGTGTRLGDPIEIAALAQAFRTSTPRRGYCAIGSVKSHIGHLDAAAGVAGLIHAVQALRHATLPPCLHFRQPNPQIDFATSPFYVNTTARPWPAAAHPRRAGVSSFGMGGTNVHVVLEEAPPAAAAVPASALPAESAPEWLLLSARSGPALRASAAQLAAHLERDPGLALADVAHTLRRGRRAHAHRAAVRADGRPDAVQALRALAGMPSGAPTADLAHGERLSERPALAFVFPGQGAQHPGMGRELYAADARFRALVDRCCEALVPTLGLDLRTLLHAAADDARASARLQDTACAQPALFITEYAMARWWMDRGVRPEALLGHSLGEYVAACLAGVFSLDDALSLVAARGQLMQATAPGAMLSVGWTEDQLQPWLTDGCDLAAVNGASQCVLAGLPAAIERAERELSAQGAAVRRLHVSHAFHSVCMAPVLAAFQARLERVALQPPQIPFVSNVTGDWIRAEDATRPAYWADHLRCTVRFDAGLGTLLARPDRVLLEVGPGDGLTALARRHALAPGRVVLATQAHPSRRDAASDPLARCAAALWVAGVDLAADALLSPHRDGRRRVPLPGYPFERQSYWIAAGAATASTPAPAAAVRNATSDGPAQALASSLYRPCWRRAEPPAPSTGSTGAALVLGVGHPLGRALAERLRAEGRAVVDDAGQSSVSEDTAALLALLRMAQAAEGGLSQVWHLSSLQSDAPALGFGSLVALGKALAGCDAGPVALHVISDGLEDVTGTEPLVPAKALLQGVARVLAQEQARLRCRVVDVLPPPSGDTASPSAWAGLAGQLLDGADAPVSADGTLALRGPHRWLRHYEPLAWPTSATPALRRGGTYLLTGGLGGVGQAMARHLAEAWSARLVLLGRHATGREHRPGIEALRARGAEVLVLDVDVTDRAAVRAAVRQATQRFGPLHGVIHAAGRAGGGRIATRSRAAMDEVLAPKVDGTSNLLEALADAAETTAPPDFVLLCSSLSAVVGGYGQADYAAANAFLDALATARMREPAVLGPRVLSVDWDVWRGLGMAAGQSLPDDVGIDPHQAGALLDAVLALRGLPQVLVSMQPLAQQFAAQQSIELAQRLAPQAPRTLHARPALRTPYQAPDGELEERLCALWGDLLGVAGVGVQDHLFELGGDSLLAVQLLARVRALYGVQLHPADVFERPTVAALAARIELRLIDELEQAGSGPAAALA